MSITVNRNAWQINGEVVPAKKVEEQIRDLEGKIEGLKAETRLHSQQRTRGRWIQRFVGFIAGLLAVVLVPLIFTSFGWSFSGMVEGTRAGIGSLTSFGLWVVGFFVGAAILIAVLFGGWKLIKTPFAWLSQKLHNFFSTESPEEV